MLMAIHGQQILIAPWLLEFRKSMGFFLECHQRSWRPWQKWCQDGCFNADPHPGNILLLEDGHTLGLIDFGQVMYLPQVVRLKHIFESLEDYTKKIS